MPNLSELLKPLTIGEYVATLIAEDKYPNLKNCILIPSEEVKRAKKGVIGRVTLKFYLIQGKDVRQLGIAFTDEEIKIVSNKFEFIRELIHEMLSTLDKGDDLHRAYDKHVKGQ